MPASVPTGYVRARAGGANVVALAAASAAVVRIVETAGTLHGHASTAPSAKAMTGRGVSYAFDAGDERWVVRHYRRGGAVARYLRDRYLHVGRTRPGIELAASVEARRRDVRTPEVIATVVYSAGIWYRADIATRFVPRSEDLAAVTFGPDKRSRDARTAAWAAAGRLLRSAFDAGLIHADLNLRNILIEEAETGAVGWLIDLDKCRVSNARDESARHAMLERFHRSRRKLERQFHRPVDAAAQAAFASALK